MNIKKKKQKKPEKKEEKCVAWYRTLNTKINEDLSSQLQTLFLFKLELYVFII